MSTIRRKDQQTSSVKAVDCYSATSKDLPQEYILFQLHKTIEQSNIILKPFRTAVASGARAGFDWEMVCRKFLDSIVLYLDSGL